MKTELFFALTAMIALFTPLRLDAQVAAQPKPQVVLIETDPWLMVIGSDSPSFVMYSDGQVIYRSETGYRTVTLSPERQAEIIAEMQFGDAMSKYAGSKATDQSTSIIILLNEGKVQGASVYGSLRRSEVRSKVPPNIVAAYDKLHGFQDPNAIEWLPEKIEVMIWPYEYAPEASIHWPRDWPAIDDSGTVQRGDSYSIFLPSAHFDELKAFVRTRNEKGAVEIGKRKWALSWRLPLPGMSGPTAPDGGAPAP